jgi:16S rRNA C967 or C1407 C5-methylase (RsmB/RsmF family)
MSTQRIIEYLKAQNIVATPSSTMHSFLDPLHELKLPKTEWSPYAKCSDHTIDLSAAERAVSMGLASMAAVEYLDLYDNISLLDMCAAPGMKSLYAVTTTPRIELYANDVSYDRVERMKRQFGKYKISASITLRDARHIHALYDPETFDRILVDVPCSGEGVALAGDEKMANAWSPAKVKRLQQLQIKILKSAWKLLKPGGRLVYSTCTLNKNENERVIKKALGVELQIREEPLNLIELPRLSHAQAWRIMPSRNSIGFFIAVLDKSEEID